VYLHTSGITMPQLIGEENELGYHDLNINPPEKDGDEGLRAALYSMLLHGVANDQHAQVLEALEQIYYNRLVDVDPSLYSLVSMEKFQNFVNEYQALKDQDSVEKFAMKYFSGADSVSSELITYMCGCLRQKIKKDILECSEDKRTAVEIDSLSKLDTKQPIDMRAALNLFFTLNFKLHIDNYGFEDHVFKDGKSTMDFGIRSIEGGESNGYQAHLNAKTAGNLESMPDFPVLSRTSSLSSNESSGMRGVPPPSPPDKSPGFARSSSFSSDESFLIGPPPPRPHEYSDSEDEHTDLDDDDESVHITFGDAADEEDDQRGEESDEEEDSDEDEELIHDNMSSFGADDVVEDYEEEEDNGEEDSVIVPPPPPPPPPPPSRSTATHAAGSGPFPPPPPFPPPGAPAATPTALTAVANIEYAKVSNFIMTEFSGIKGTTTKYAAVRRPDDTIVVSKKTAHGGALEKIATISPTPSVAAGTAVKTITHCKVERGKEYDGTMFLLNSYQEIIRKNPAPAGREYEATFGNLTTVQKAENFLQAYHDTFLDSGAISSTLKIKFDAASKAKLISILQSPGTATLAKDTKDLLKEHFEHLINPTATHPHSPRKPRFM
jgi:hypothetical protein